MLLLAHLDGEMRGARSSMLGLILHGKWYLNKKNTEEEENIHIVEAAADIIRRDIRSLVFNTKVYPAMESLDSGQLPETLKTFLKRVIQGEVVEIKNTAIREAIMSACHPHSYLFPTLLGIGLYIHRHHASRQLVDILSSFSFSASYKEVQRYEFSALEHDRANTRGGKKGYIQYAFDNADFNIRTLRGHGTFYSMGGVRFIIPAQNQESMTVNRLLHLPSADIITARGKHELYCTYDHPLYAKASEIIAAGPPGELDSVTLWLGGFHLLVSFMGSIGFIMSGSGIEELWMQVYTKSSVTHMLLGHAFSRAA
ncbi:hypothetical protein PR048_021535 [Dryococelus australis]|uniref:Uncharacterized protein n=1 Tax=Dryococelus australis TaxID=614101 RepID=A0ABQ9GYI3_9NEOP|nr:hypothetical protein PR048_021535 [Dryococelus australis]